MSQPPDQPYSGEPHPAPPAPGLAQPGTPYGRPSAPSGPTEYPQPAYQQPGYPQPGYQQPGYPQPGYPQAGPGPVGQLGAGVIGGFPPAPAAAPRERSTVLPILLGAVAVLLVLCVGGVTAAFFVLKNDADRTVGAPAPAGTPRGPLRGTSGTGAPTTAPTVPAQRIRLLEPARLNGRPKLTDPQFAGAAKTLQDSLDQAPGATDSIGALYGDPAKRTIVVVAAVAAPISDPERELSATFRGAGTTGMKLTDVVTVPPGPLGGRAQCGNSRVAGVKMAMCAWADNGSVGWFIWYFRSTGQVKGEFTKLRGLIEKAR